MFVGSGHEIKRYLGIGFREEITPYQYAQQINCNTQTSNVVT
jgi:hypothetical protein